jgi:hypothetical protein
MFDSPGKSRGDNNFKWYWSGKFLLLVTVMCCRLLLLVLVLSAGLHKYPLVLGELKEKSTDIYIHCTTNLLMSAFS